MPNNDEPVCKKKKQTVEYKQKQLELVKVIAQGRFKVRSTITSWIVWHEVQFLVFMWRHNFLKQKMVNASEVLVSTDVRPSNNLTFCNVLAL